MKVFTRDSSKYGYNYEKFALADPSDSFDNIYNKGYIASRLPDHSFYLARSTRINLDEFVLTSENRRILRKTENVLLKVHKMTQYEYHYSIGKLAKDFYTKKFNNVQFSPQRVKGIFSENFFNYVAEYSDNNKILGYCILMIGENFVRYAYPFYTLDSRQPNMGIGMMLKAITWAKDNGYKYIYLGTCESKETTYKLQFPGFEWFYSNTWSTDLNKLKELVK